MNTTNLRDEKAVRELICIYLDKPLASWQRGVLDVRLLARRR